MSFTGKLKIGVILATSAVALLYIANASSLAPPLEGLPKVLSHRGVHTLFDRTALNNDTCTAAQSLHPVQLPIENTIGSMERAFNLGADVVELDVNLTTDGEFAVFHDWTLDCRTNGSGEVRRSTMSALRNLDIGYGYTADGGQTFPLRGQGIGAMPSLIEVLEHFPDRNFLIDFKSNEKIDGERFIEIITDRPDFAAKIWGIYGGKEPVETVLVEHPELRGFYRQSVEECLLNYILLGWASYAPSACRNTVVLVPVDLSPYLWGWPDRFLHRMSSAGSSIVLRGPLRGADASDGVDTVALLPQIPRSDLIYIWTNSSSVIDAVSKMNSSLPSR